LEEEEEEEEEEMDGYNHVAKTSHLLA